MSGTTVFSARKILTMNNYLPMATHVAIRDKKILGVGTLDQMSSWGDFTLNDRFRHQILMPGLVEGHSHAMEGGIWSYTYVGYQDRYDPDGKKWTGAVNLDAVIERLRKAEEKLQDPDEPRTNHCSPGVLIRFTSTPTE